MTAANITCFLCGSLVACIGCFLLVWRQERLDHRVIRHIRRNEYLRGWKDGTNQSWREDA